MGAQRRAKVKASTVPQRCHTPEVPLMKSSNATGDPGRCTAGTLDCVFKGLFDCKGCHYYVNTDSLRWNVSLFVSQLQYFLIH